MKKIKELLQKTIDLLNSQRRLFKLVWKWGSGTIISLVILALFSSGLAFIQSGLTALLVNELIRDVGRGFTSMLLYLAIASIVASYLPDLIGYISNFLSKRNWINNSERLQLMVIEKRNHIDIQTYDDPKFQDLTEKLNSRDVWPAAQLIESSISNVTNIVSVIIALVILLNFSPLVSLLVLVGIIPQFIIQIKYGNDTWSIWDADTETRRKYSDLRNYVDNRTSVVESKLFRNIPFFFRQIKDILVQFNDKQRNIEKKNLIFEIIGTFASSILIGIGIFILISRTATGLIQIGSMTFLLSSIFRLQGSLGSFFSSIARQYEHNLYVMNIFKFLDVKPALVHSSAPTKLLGNTPKIVFDHVSFSYPFGSEAKPGGILKDINLTIAPGEKFALVGENGAGKSTFVKLLCRVYDPTEGAIYIDGVNLKDVHLDSWYSMLGVLFQDYTSYHLPVKNVIALGNTDAELTLERVEEAAEGSEAAKFINEWKNGYDQQLGTEFTGGIDPSKGQGQRLAIARLLYRKAGVMILDEPTAAIDAEAEAKIFETFESLSGSQTVFLISHKYSTVRKATRIAVFKDGTVAELGSHDELMAKQEGLYAKLFGEQAKAYDK